MTDISQGEAAPSDVPEVIAPKGTPDSINFSEAARLLQSARYPKKEQPAEAPAEAAEPEPELPAQAESSAPPETEAPADATESQPEPAQEPPIEPPRSWTTDEKQRFKTLPRETQEYLLNRETERDRDLRRSQNEAAEKLKGLTAKEQAAEQLRQQYEAALPQFLQAAYEQQQGAFADIKTIADVEKLASEDWPRYLQWDVSQKKIAAAQQEYLLVQQRQSQERLQKFNEFAKHEDTLFTEKAPEMANPEKAAELQSKAIEVLKDIGFTLDELAASWHGQRDISLRDHRMQLLIRDARSWREAQTKVRAAVAKPVPPVQRPGVAPERNAGREAEIQNLSRQLDSATSGLQQTRIAAQLLAARRANRR